MAAGVATEPKEVRVVVGGTRTFDDYPFLCDKMDTLVEKIKHKGKLIVCHGACKHKDDDGRRVGADELADKWALSRKYTVMRYHPDWQLHGKAAGPIRNREMARDCGPAAYVVVFWDGVSPGTKNLLDEVRKAGVPAGRIRVIRVGGGDD